MDEWRHWARTLIVRSSRVGWIRILLRNACRVGTWIVGRRLAALPGVASVYVRHSHPGSVTFAPGQSDLDLTLVLDDDAAQNANVLRACTKELSALNRMFYFVWPQDVRFVSRRELAQMEVLPGTAEILNAPNRWVHIGGGEVRRPQRAGAISRNRIALHPEFNSWWLNVMQTHVLTLQTEFSEHNMRLCFRVAMKSRLHLAAARGHMDLASEAYLGDSKAASLFAGDAEMAELLDEIKRKKFWSQDVEDSKARIFQKCIASAADFYRELPVRSDTSSVEVSRSPSPLIAPEHRSDLQHRFEREPALRAIADGIIIYPTPHWFPREYQIDVLVREGVSPAAFRDAVGAVKRSLGGRTFGFSGSQAQVTFLPRSAFEHPSFFLGTPFPFLHEHIAKFAEALLGTPPRVPAPPSRADRVEWCAQYYFFHRFTLRYRPRYLSKDCNFCQLAAIRLYLEYGLVSTDAGRIRTEYLKLYGKRSEDVEALDFLLQGPSEVSQDDAVLDCAFRIQMREYDAIEALLRQHGVRI